MQANLKTSVSNSGLYSTGNFYLILGCTSRVNYGVFGENFDPLL